MDQPDDLRAAIYADRVTVNGTTTPLSLRADGTLWWPEGGQRSLTIEKEVLGFVDDGPNIRLKTAVETRVGCCAASGGGGRGALARNDVLFRPSSEESHGLWCQKLREFIDSLGRPKRLFVFVNPFGGKKSATNIFHDQVKPLFEDARVQLTVQETKNQLHAKEVVSSLDVSKYDGIVCVSGDGILVERHAFVVDYKWTASEGGLGRCNKDTHWSSSCSDFLAKEMILPQGTGNGMAKSLLDSVGDFCSVANAVLAIIRGHKRSLDVATITQGGIRYFSLLMLAWGLIADIDIESEKYRWMGSARIDFYGLNRICNLRHYTGYVYFVPAPGFEAYGEPSNYPGNSISKGSDSDPIGMEPVNSKRPCYQGPEINLEKLSWRVLNGPFISVWLHNVPWAAENTMAAPDAKFSDGCLYLIIVKNCPKIPLLSLLSEMNNGGHVKSPYVMHQKVKALILEPGPRLEDQEKEGIIDVDGEVLARGKGSYQCDQKALMAYDKLQITVDQGLATLFTPI